MTINLTREDFEQAIKSGASVFEGNTIPDTGKPSGRYYRFIRVPLANGEHKVDALYGQRFYGTLEKKPVTFNQGMGESEFRRTYYHRNLESRRRTRLQLS